MTRQLLVDVICDGSASDGWWILLRRKGFFLFSKSKEIPATSRKKVLNISLERVKDIQIRARILFFPAHVHRFRLTL